MSPEYFQMGQLNVIHLPMKVIVPCSPLQRAGGSANELRPHGQPRQNSLFRGRVFKAKALVVTHRYFLRRSLEQGSVKNSSDFGIARIDRPKIPRPQLRDVVVVSNR